MTILKTKETKGYYRFMGAAILVIKTDSPAVHYIFLYDFPIAFGKPYKKDTVLIGAMLEI
jgi:hypothetical protein